MKSDEDDDVRSRFGGTTDGLDNNIEDRPEGCSRNMEKSEERCVIGP